MEVHDIMHVAAAPHECVQVVIPGSDWKLLRLAGEELVLDLAEYQISRSERVLGILLFMSALRHRRALMSILPPDVERKR